MSSDVDDCKIKMVYTIPLNCQICLDQVRMPVVCPNQHLFCGPCLKLWLKSHAECPTCRTAISEDTCVPIRGTATSGTEAELDEKGRIDILCHRSKRLTKDYQKELKRLSRELEQARSDVTSLQEGLASRVADVEGAMKGIKGMPGEGGTAPVADASTAAAAPGTKCNCCTAKTVACYADTCSALEKVLADERASMDKLKQENIVLAHEVRRLKQEQLTTSPRKTARCIAAAEGNHAVSLEREVSQLRRALDRSDRCIEHLKEQLAASSSTAVNNTGTSNSAPGDVCSRDSSDTPLAPCAVVSTPPLAPCKRAALSEIPGGCFNPPPSTTCMETLGLSYDNSITAPCSVNSPNSAAVVSLPSLGSKDAPQLPPLPSVSLPGAFKRACTAVTPSEMPSPAGPGLAAGTLCVGSGASSISPAAGIYAVPSMDPVRLDFSAHGKSSCSSGASTSAASSALALLPSADQMRPPSADQMRALPLAPVDPALPSNPVLQLSPAVRSRIHSSHRVQSSNMLPPALAMPAAGTGAAPPSLCLPPMPTAGIQTMAMSAAHSTPAFTTGSGSGMAPAGAFGPDLFTSHDASLVAALRGMTPAIASRALPVSMGSLVTESLASGPPTSVALPGNRVWQ